MEGELRREQMLQWCVKRLEPLVYATKVPTRFIYSMFFLNIFGGRRKIDNSCIVGVACNKHACLLNIHLSRSYVDTAQLFGTGVLLQQSIANCLKVNDFM